MIHPAFFSRAAAATAPSQSKFNCMLRIHERSERVRIAGSIFANTLVKTLSVVAAGLTMFAWGASAEQAAPVVAPAKAATHSAAIPAKAAIAAKSAPGGVIAKVGTVEGITEYQLANGLKVLLFPDQSKPTVTVNMTIMVGSRHENYGETGMAHLLEHLLFKGTPKNPDIDKNFNKRGMRFNGSTWLDRTNYFELFQANDDNLEWALQMEADRLMNSFVAKKDLDSEMTVVRNEYESGENQPFNVMLKRMQSIAFDWHNYGNSTIGNRSDIENVKIENLQGFYHRYYQPDNAVLLVAGKFDEAKVLQWVGKYFAVIHKPTRVLPKLWTVEPTQDGERQFFVRRKGDIQIVGLGYKVPSGLHPDSDAIGFMNYVLTDSPTGRLHKALVETGKAAQIFGFPLFGADGGLHMIGAVVKKGDSVEVVRDEMIKAVEEFYKNPPTPVEIERAKKNFANAAERTLNNHESIGVELSETIALGDWRLFFQGRDRAVAMTALQIQEAAARYYKRDNRVLGYFIPEDSPQRADVPAPPTVADAMKGFVAKQVVSNAEAFNPANENVEKRTKIINIGGLKVALLSKLNRGETVNMSVRLQSGDEKSLFGKATVASMTGQMLSRGTNKLSREQIADASEKLKIEGSVSGLSADLQTTKPNLVEAIKFAAHVMRDANFPESEFEQLRKQILTGIESQKSDPQAVASNALAKQFNTYPKGDFRYVNSLDEAEQDTKAVTLAQVREFHKNFYGANQGEIAVVGDFDEAAVTQAIREAFGEWKGGAPYTRLSNAFKEIPVANANLETPDKENAMFLARINVNLLDDDADYPALFVANYIMGGGAGFDSRLMARIRVKDGLSYGAGSQLNVGSKDRGSSWIAYAIAAPQNVAKVEAAFKEEVAKALKDGFLLTEVVAAKSGILQQRLQSRAQDSGLAGRWTTYLDLGRTFVWSAQFEANVSALKPEDVSAAFRKYINIDKISMVKAGDFAKANKSVGKISPAAK